MARPLRAGAMYKLQLVAIGEIQKICIVFSVFVTRLLLI